jgi:DNA primase
MNVKVCTFPDGEDPDSFAKKTSHDDLLSWKIMQRFHQFKASLLMNEAKNDPIKADLIRDMVVSISKYQIEFKRNIPGMFRIMDISEQVLELVSS